MLVIRKHPEKNKETRSMAEYGKILVRCGLVCDKSTPLACESFCYTKPIEDGSDGPFNQEPYDHSKDTNQEDDYYNGFHNGVTILAKTMLIIKIQ